MLKSISFIVLTQFFQFNELKNFKAIKLLHFFKLNQQYFLQCNNFIAIKQKQTHCLNDLYITAVFLMLLFIYAM